MTLQIIVATLRRSCGNVFFLSTKRENARIFTDENVFFCFFFLGGINSYEDDD